MIYFTSDFHFNHTNICGPSISNWKSGYRNFSSIKEMNELILNNLNEKVKESDTLYFLGDFAFGDKKLIPSLVQQIACKNIHLIFGNHDYAIRKYYQNLFLSCHDYYELSYKKNVFCLFHYPMASWNHVYSHQSFQPHGHCHGNYVTPHSGQIDVGVDNLNFYPISIEEYIEVSQKEFSRLAVDHHSMG